MAAYVYKGIIAAAEAAGVSVGTIHRWIKTGRLKARQEPATGKAGRPSLLITRTDLAAAAGRPLPTPEPDERPRRPWQWRPRRRSNSAPPTSPGSPFGMSGR